MFVQTVSQQDPFAATNHVCRKLTAVLGSAWNDVTTGILVGPVSRAAAVTHPVRFKIMRSPCCARVHHAISQYS